MLSKDECLFERDEKGELIARKVNLDTLEGKPEVKVKPLPRGKLISIYRKAKDGNEEEKVQADAEVIKEGLVEPALSDKEIEALKPKYASAISIAVMSESLGIEQSEVNKTTDALNIEETATKN